ncbi:hypothetical protein F4811DRAFT_390234 [Daldinia bambusicola]|nr:hypothetical protein F4811DRAFT_390234 [Daldinia bambusicola]
MRSLGCRQERVRGPRSLRSSLLCYVRLTNRYRVLKMYFFFFFLTNPPRIPKISTNLSLFLSGSGFFSPPLVTFTIAYPYPSIIYLYWLGR